MSGRFALYDCVCSCVRARFGGEERWAHACIHPSSDEGCNNDGASHPGRFVRVMEMPGPATEADKADVLRHLAREAGLVVPEALARAVARRADHCSPSDLGTLLERAQLAASMRGIRIVANGSSGNSDGRPSFDLDWSDPATARLECPALGVLFRGGPVPGGL